MDWIGHHCDIGHWGLSNPKFGCGPDDQIGPLEVSAKAEFPPNDAVWNTAAKYRVECKYPNGVEVVIAGGHADIKGGTKWIGENGWVGVDRGRFEASKPEWKNEHRARREAEKELDFTLMVSQATSASSSTASSRGRRRSRRSRSPTARRRRATWATSPRSSAASCSGTPPSKRSSATTRRRNCSLGPCVSHGTCRVATRLQTAANRTGKGGSRRSSAEADVHVGPRGAAAAVVVAVVVHTGRRRGGSSTATARVERAEDDFGVGRRPAPGAAG